MIESSVVTKQERVSTVLIVDDNREFVSLFARVFDEYDVIGAYDGQEALELVAQHKPNLIVCDINMPNMGGMAFLEVLRANRDYENIPVIMLTASNNKENIIHCFELGADSFHEKPIDIDILKANIRAKLKRLPMPVSQIIRDYHTHMLTRPAFLEELEREIVRAEKRKSNAKLACLEIFELEKVCMEFGVTYEFVLKQVSSLIYLNSSPIEVTGHDDDGRLLILIPEMPPDEARDWLRYVSRTITRHEFIVARERISLTPIIGFTPIRKQTPVEQIYEEALTALQHAASQLDLEPIRYQESFSQTAHTKQAQSRRSRFKLINMIRSNFRVIAQILFTFFIGIGLPFIIYVLLGDAANGLTQIVYLLVIVALLGTAGLIWVEGLLAQRQVELPEITAPYPPASAIIAAYLPNEAATIVSTVEAFLKLDYPSPIQIIVAYNTPYTLPVEDTLREIAQKHPNFQPIKIDGSTSKAQNVNTALSYAEGEFVGIFDADHQPDPNSFKRAWAWLSNGYDVVQGHCLVRNGHVSSVARTIAVEFESIYGMSHPGRARMHRFGIFGGSNGYWRTDLLRETRMHGFMLTEDIDSSIRTVIDGTRIYSDPHLISRELAPTTLKALWNQRMRWAQGWFQVSKVQTLPALLSGNMSIRQKLGIFHLLVWREIYPWLSLQIIPLILYWAWRSGGFDQIDWFIPIFVITSIITLSTGPLTVYFVYRLAEPSIKKNRHWFWYYMVMALFYTEFKNLVARVAQLKELMGERIWRTTPRA